MESRMKSHLQRQLDLRKWHQDFYVRISQFFKKPPRTSSIYILNFPCNCAAITLKCTGASIGEKPPLTKKLPATTTVANSLSLLAICTVIFYVHLAIDNLMQMLQVGKLKLLCESFFKMKSIRPRLFLQEEVMFSSNRYTRNTWFISLSLNKARQYWKMTMYVGFSIARFAERWNGIFVRCWSFWRINRSHWWRELIQQTWALWTHSARPSEPSQRQVLERGWSTFVHSSFKDLLFNGGYNLSKSFVLVCLKLMSKPEIYHLNYN